MSSVNPKGEIRGLEAMNQLLTESIREKDKEIGRLTKELASATAKIRNLEAQTAPSDDDDDDDEVSVTDQLGNDPWSRKVVLLMSYKQQHGDCKVPGSHKELGAFVHNQRSHYNYWKAGKKTSMTQERIDILNHIGFFWGAKHPAPKSWDDWMEEFEGLHEKLGTNPRDVDKTTDLGKWVRRQRRDLKRLKKGSVSSLSLDQASRLKAVGF